MAATGWTLALMALVCAVSTVLVGQYERSAFRYPDWVVVSRFAMESTALALPAGAVVAGLLARRVLFRRLLWLAPHLPRSGATVRRTAAAMGLAAAAGYAIGLIPVTVWAIDDAHHGSLDAVAVAGALAWVYAIVTLVCALSVTTSKGWIGIVLGVILFGSFYWGYTANATYSHFTTHLGVLPFDGQSIPFGSGQLVVTPRLEVSRLVGGLLLGLATTFALPYAAGGRTGAGQLRLVIPALLAVLAAFAASCVPSVPVTTSRNQPVRCQAIDDVNVCVLASHVHDLHVVVDVVGRIRTAAGARLFPQHTVLEDPAATRIAPTVLPITVSAESGVSPTSDAAQQISLLITHFDVCVDGPGHTSDNINAVSAVADWFAHVGGSNRTTSPASASLIKKWSSDPAQTDRAFQSDIGRLRDCTLTSANLP